MGNLLNRGRSRSESPDCDRSEYLRQQEQIRKWLEEPDRPTKPAPICPPFPRRRPPPDAVWAGHLEVVWPYESQSFYELTLVPGEVIFHMEETDQLGWAFGLRSRQGTGYYPATFVHPFYLTRRSIREANEWFRNTGGEACLARAIAAENERRQRFRRWWVVCTSDNVFCKKLCFSTSHPQQWILCSVLCLLIFRPSRTEPTIPFYIKISTIL